MRKEVFIPYRYEPREYQMPFWDAMDNDCRRSIVVWHRRAGKDTTCLNQHIKRMFERVGYYPYFFPTGSMGRKILWDGIDRKGFKFMDYFPRSVVAGRNASEMKVTLVNGSIFQIVGTDRIEIVGTNPLGCTFSEYSLQHPRGWEFARPILAENGGWAAFNFTPRGKNHAYDLFTMAQANPDWFVQLLTANDTGAITEEAIDAERRSGMSEDMIQQEFYCSWDMGQEGSYYGRFMSEALMSGRICSVPFDPAVRVFTAWDLGISDSTTIWFVQKVGQEYHVIDYYENQGEAISHYAQVMEEKAKTYGYLYDTNYGPHDLRAREKGTGLSLLRQAADIGLYWEPLKCDRVQTGIEAVRAILPRCWFDQVKCAQGIKCLENYRKRLDESHNVYTNLPLHDWSSHAADAFRYLAIGLSAGSGRSGGMTAQQAKELYERYARPVSA